MMSRKQRSLYKPTMKDVMDLVKNLPIEIASPKKNLAILRREKESFTIFLHRNNDETKLKEFLYDDPNLDSTTIDGRIDYLLSEK